MRKATFTFVFGVLFTTAVVSYAQAQQSAESAAAQHERTNLRQRLALNAGQVAQLRSINQERKAQLDTVKNDASLPAAAKRQKVKEIHASAESKIRGMLTENQQAEYDQIKRERREQALRQRQAAQPSQ